MEDLKTRKVILSMQVSLDGYVEGPDGDMSWIVTDSGDEWEIMFEGLKNADTFVTGSNMYDGYVEYWKAVLNKPDSFPGALVKYAKIAENTTHILASRKGHEPKWANTRVSNDLANELTLLKQQPGKDIFVWGGADTASFLINKNLIDQFRLIVNPVILGGGKSLFNNVNHKALLKLKESRVLQGGLVFLKYEPA